MSRLKRWVRRGAWVAAMAFSVLLAVWGAAEALTAWRAAPYCHGSVQDCPRDRVGLVLGCAPYLPGGWANRYFVGRMDAAAELWKSGKVRCLIVSGDNLNPCYNEPKAMREALAKRGVPEEFIVSDYAGICTYDSVVRAHRVFGAERMIVVSQPAHVRRAVAIARCLRVEADGLEAPLAPVSFFSSLRQYARERAARVAMLYDLLVQRRPRFLGAPESLPSVNR